MNDPITSSLPGEGWGKTTIRVGDVVKYHDTAHNSRPRGLIHRVKVLSFEHRGNLTALIQFVKPSKSPYAFWIAGSTTVVNIWWLEGGAK